MLFNKIGDLYDWWFYKSLYRSIVDVKSVFFSGNSKLLLNDTTVTDFELEMNTVFTVNIWVITVIESK